MVAAVSPIRCDALGFCAGAPVVFGNAKKKISGMVSWPQLGYTADVMLADEPSSVAGNIFWRIFVI